MMPNETQTSVEEPSTLLTRAALAGRLSIVLFALFITVGAGTQFLSAAYGIWFTEVFLFLGVTATFVRWSGRDPLLYPKLVSPGLASVTFGFLAGVANFFALVVPLQTIALALAPPALKKLFDSSQIFQHQTPLELALIVFGVGIAAPVCEEYFFRGVLQQGLSSSAQRSRSALLLSAFVFSAFHLDPVGFVARFELGILFGVLFYKTGSLWPGIAAHAANNLVSTVLYFLAGGQSETDGQLSPLAWATLLLIGLPVVFALVRASRTWAKATPLVPSQAAFGRKQPRLGELGMPWVMAALLSLTVLLFADRRGVRLNIEDARTPLPSASEMRSPSERTERDALEALRTQARQGRISLQEYIRARRAFAQKYRALHGHPPRNRPWERLLKTPPPEQ